MSENAEAELEHFRQQWREEVTARTNNKTEEQAKRQRRHLNNQNQNQQKQKQQQKQQQQRSKNLDDVSKTPTNRPAGITTDSQVAKASTPPTTTVGSGKARKQYVELGSATGTSDRGVSELRTFDEDDEAAGRDANYSGSSSKGGRTLVAEKGPGDAEEPRSALEHYERAVEKECLGSLGESVSLYRKAFKLDDAVHETYKNKYFPPPTSKSEATAKTAAGTKATQSNPSNTSETVRNTAHHLLDGLSPSVSELLNIFAGLSIEGTTSDTDQKLSLQSSSTIKSPVSEPSMPLSSPSLSSAEERSEKLPCPIATLPEELLVEILKQVAIQDFGIFARFAVVCRRLAYIVMTEERVWKRVALGHEFGFAGMHYRYACDLNGKPLRYDYGDNENSRGGGRVLRDGDGMDGTSNSVMHEQKVDPATIFALSPTYPTYRQMLRQRPRIRFNGLYISTINYSRPGAPSTSQLTWNSPVLIVTYYRYLRFYRDGTVISLLTVTDPSEVVPVFHRENIPVNCYKQKLQNRQYHHQKSHSSHQSNQSTSTALASAPAPAHSPSSIMKDALRGRWRLSGFQDTLGQADPTLYDVAKQNEGILHVETEGVIPKYTWNMRFALANAGRTDSCNNKLVWIDYRCYNRLTDDWGEFGLKNDRPFRWIRVRSYGSGP